MDATPSSPAAPLVAVRGLVLTVPSAAGPVNILRGIDLDIAAGEAVGLIGPSGSGKTSLLMVLAGLERVSAGSVRFAGEEITALDEDALARLRRAAIGIVFQAFHLIPTMTALENVAVPLELAGRRDAEARAGAALRAAGLGHRLTHLPGQLSGGEQQRVALARAFAPEPRLLLADEPTGNLDQATGEAVMDKLFELRARTGTTLLLVTHDAALAARCERRIHIADGRVTEVERKLLPLPLREGVGGRGSGARTSDATLARPLPPTPSHKGRGRYGTVLLALRLARRELRGGVRGLRIVVACLALGVAVIGAVGTLRVAIERGLAADGRRLLGGDLEIELRLAAPAGRRARLAGRARRAAVEHRRVAHPAGRPVGERTLVELKAVDPAWPLVGTVGTDPARPGRAGAGRTGRAIRAADQPGRARSAGPAPRGYRAPGQRQLHRPRGVDIRTRRARHAGAVRPARGDPAGGGARDRPDRAGVAGHLPAAGWCCRPGLMPPP